MPLGSAIMGGDANEDVLHIRLRILHEHVEVTAFVEHPGVEKFKLRFPAFPRLPFLLH